MDDLPIEILRRIITFLSPKTAAALASVSRTWSSLAQPQAWRSLSILPIASISVDVTGHDPISSAAYDASTVEALALRWKTFASLIRIRPYLRDSVRRFTLVADESTAEVALSTVRLLAQQLQSLKIIPTSANSGYEQDMSLQVIDAARLFPRLLELELQLGTNTWLELLLALRSTPGLTKLVVVSSHSLGDGDPDDIEYPRLGPDLAKVRELSVTVAFWSHGCVELLRHMPALEILRLRLPPGPRLEESCDCEYLTAHPRLEYLSLTDHALADLANHTVICNQPLKTLEILVGDDGVSCHWVWRCRDLTIARFNPTVLDSPCHSSDSV